MQNDVRTLHIIHDSCMNATKFRILSIVDAFTKVSLALEVSTRINAKTPLRSVLGRLFTNKAVPGCLRSDNGGEFIARSTGMQLQEVRWSARFIQPRKPSQNGLIEFFQSTLRRDDLNVEVIFNLMDAQLKTGIYTNDTNQVVPHSALGHKAPTEVAAIKARSLMVPLGYQVRADHEGIQSMHVVAHPCG